MKRRQNSPAMFLERRQLLLLAMGMMGFLSGGCARIDHLDRSLLNHPGMDFNFSLTAPANVEKTRLGKSNSQNSEAGCSTCAY